MNDSDDISYTLLAFVVCMCVCACKNSHLLFVSPVTADTFRSLTVVWTLNLAVLSEL
jgi:hypothetical protein